jgi:hypothetical protein
MRTWRIVVVVAFVLGTGFLFYRWWQVASSKAERRHGGQGEPDESAQPAALGMGAGGGQGGQGAAAASAEHEGPPLDRAKADRMREQIRALLADAGLWALGGKPVEQPSAKPAGSYPTMPLNPNRDAGEAAVDPEYIKQRIHEDLFPLAKQCYTNALEKNPKLGGRLEVSFKVMGDKKVGGVVDEVKLLDGTTIDDPEMQTCVRESMMSVSFDAPPDDGALTVVYPIEFSPGESDGG